MKQNFTNTETIGIDLGDRTSRYCIVDAHGEVVEEGSFRNQRDSIQKHFSGSACTIALEGSKAWAAVAGRFGFTFNSALRLTPS
jgi:hypothetical protein